MREGAAELLATCLDIVGQRDRGERAGRAIYAKVLADAQAGLKAASPDTVHGSLLTYRELFLHAGMVCSKYSNSDTHLTWVGSSCERRLWTQPKPFFVSRATEKALSVGWPLLSYLRLPCTTLRLSPSIFCINQWVTSLHSSPNPPNEPSVCVRTRPSLHNSDRLQPSLPSDTWLLLLEVK